MSATGRNPSPSASSAGKVSSVSIFAILVVTWALIYVPGLFRPGLLDDADSVHAEAAREMVLRHDWVTLYTDGVRYLEKSPLMYWMVAASYKFFGVSEWQTRLPLALGVLALIGTTYLFGRRVFGQEGGFYAGLIIATAPGIFLFTRPLLPDVLVVLWLTATLYLFFIASEQEHPSRWMCWGMAATVALNVLSKSLIGLVFPGIIILAFLLLTGDLRKLARLRLVSSAFVFLAVAAPWHVLAALRNPGRDSSLGKGFLWFYFINEQFLRYLGKRVPYDYDKVPWVVFVVLLLVWIIPWCVFLFPALKEIPRSWRSWRESLDPRGRANLLFAIWAVIIVGFFSFSSRQEYYTLPAIPPLALLIAGWLERESRSEPQSRERRAGIVASTVLLATGILAFIATMTLVYVTKPFSPGTDIGDVLTQHVGHYKLSLGHMQDLTIEGLGLFRTPLWELGVGLLLGTGLNWLFRRRRAARAANLALTGMMVAVLYCVWQGLVIFSPVLSSKQMALEIQKQYQPGDTIVVNRAYEWGSSVNFYTGVPVHLLNGRHYDIWFGSLFRDTPRIFEDDESFARLWNGPHRVFFFSQDSFLSAEPLPGIDRRTIHVFARSGGKSVLTNR